MMKAPQPVSHAMRCGGIRFRHTPRANNKAQGVPADIVRFVTSPSQSYCHGCSGSGQAGRIDAGLMQVSTN